MCCVFHLPAARSLSIFDRATASSNVTIAAFFPRWFSLRLKARSAIVRLITISTVRLILSSPSLQYILYNNSLLFLVSGFFLTPCRGQLIVRRIVPYWKAKRSGVVLYREWYRLIFFILIAIKLNETLIIRISMSAFSSCIYCIAYLLIYLNDLFFPVGYTRASIISSTYIYTYTFMCINGYKVRARRVGRPSSSDNNSRSSRAYKERVLNVCSVNNECWIGRAAAISRYYVLDYTATAAAGHMEAGQRCVSRL